MPIDVIKCPISFHDTAKTKYTPMEKKSLDDFA
jgi:hypothetical protein